MHPAEKQRVPFVAQQLAKRAGPVIASTDYMKSFADQVRAFIPADKSYRVLGIDGFGRSDSREKLREHFEVNRHYVVLAALRSLVEQKVLDAKVCEQAIKQYGIDVDKVSPAFA